MTINEIFGLRNQGRKEEAYEAARSVYATNKSPYASAAMFWTAVDVLRMRISENRQEEARKIFMALERLLDHAKDEKGWMHDAMEECQALVEKKQSPKDGPEHLQMGVWGEELAVAYLQEKGYVILERDWHYKHRDIDIIAQDGNFTVFVEVKTRRSRDFGDPRESVGYIKQKNLNRAIGNYIRYRKLNNPCRFDVITIVGEMGSKMPEINHIIDFALDSRI